jgi:hypothetical protein
MTELTELHGKPRKAKDVEEYETPDEYAEQGDTRVIRDLRFSYLAATEDANGQIILEPVDLVRGEEVTLDELGKLALKKGEENHSFYTTAERERVEAGQPEGGSSATATEGGNVSELGEYELADYIKGANPEGRALKAQEVVDLAGNDTDLAHRLLQAENIASDGDPRKSVEAGLTSIIEGGNQ